MVVYDDKCTLKHRTWDWPFTTARAALLSHPQCNSGLKQGKGERGHQHFTDSVISQNLRAAHRAREGVQLGCASRLPASPGGEAIERAAGNIAS